MLSIVGIGKRLSGSPKPQIYLVDAGLCLQTKVWKFVSCGMKVCFLWYWVAEDTFQMIEELKSSKMLEKLLTACSVLPFKVSWFRKL